MTSFDSLPAELQRHCVQFFEPRTLKNFRLVSRHSGVIGAEHLFKTVRLLFTESSTQKFTSILENEKARPLVQNIALDGEKAVGSKEYDLDDYTRFDTPWYLAISKLAQFPNLRHVGFRFHKECAVEDEVKEYRQENEWRKDYQEQLFRSLEDVHRLDSLAIRNIQDAIVSHTGPQKAAEKVFSRIREVALKIVTEYWDTYPERSIYFDALHRCFNHELYNTWLKPTQAQLTHLTIYCDAFWGVWPLMDFRGIHFPNMKSLALGKWTIGHDWQIEWIASHGEKLERLVLDGVTLVYVFIMGTKTADANWPELRPVEGWNQTHKENNVLKLYETRWSDIFPIFQARLPKLRHFGIGRDTWHKDTFKHRYESPARIDDSRYMVYQVGSNCWNGPWLWKAEDVWNDDSDYNYSDDTDEEDDSVPKLKNEHGLWVEVPKPKGEQRMKDEEALNALLKAIGK